MEWSADGVFEDKETLAVVNRLMPVVPFKKTIKGNSLALKTDALVLEYADDGKEFSKANLTVSFVLKGKKVKWFPGKPDPHNLKGTARTLDGSKNAHTELGDGFVSRSGWGVIDDADNVVIDWVGKVRWAKSRPTARRQDFYLLAYGHDYKAALHDAARILGRQPLPPRYTLGYWWSRYWAYTDKEFEGLVNSFNTMNVPIDVMVVDMDWHLEGWTGYTWDKRYFPDHVEFLKWLKDDDLKVTLNLHPAQGVGKHEEQFRAMAKALGLDPRVIERIPFDCTSPEYMKAYFEHLHRPHEKNGVDFWWMDWQQGKGSLMRGLDPLAWLNRLHWEDMEVNGGNTRPLILSRFGGVGAGRYPLGFSGDTYSIWKSLEFQPHFTATAANVLYGYWSHDIGGHAPGTIEPELYTRWVQFGAFSPILRTHTTKNPKSERRFWEYPDPHSKVMMDAVRRRYELVPYIYTENRKCYDNAVSLCRPMYYDNPESDGAYKATQQFMFGSEMIVAPVLKPVDAEDGMAEVSVWLPKGEWFDIATGMMAKGDRTIKRRYNIYETPVFVKAGAIIPGQRAANRLKEGSYRNLVVTVYPGKSGFYILYEDDGISRDYIDGKFATIPMSHKESGGKHTIYIGRAQGSYRGFAKERSLEIRLAGSPPPKAITVAGKAVPWAYRLGESGWAYDGDNATTVIRVPRFDITKGLAIEIVPNKSIPSEMAFGLKGILSRLAVARHSVPEYPAERLVIEAVQAGNRISRKPEKFKAEIKHLSGILKKLPAALAVKPGNFNVDIARKDIAMPIAKAILREFKDVLVK
jgi:alpha-glucosidase